MASKPTAPTKPNLGNGRKCVVLIGGIYNMFVALGLLFSINTLYVELLDVFQTTRRETSLVQTTLIGIAFSSGLISGIIVRRLGVKTSLTVGALLAFLGCFLGWFATSIPYLIVTIGVVTGSGTSLIFISTNVLVATTFTERRNMALALVMFGSGLGQLLFPRLFEKLMTVYGWRGCLLITSGFYLNILVSCFLTTSSLGASIPFRLPRHDQQKNETKARWQATLKLLFVLFVILEMVSLGTTGNLVVLLMDYLDNQGFPLQTSINMYMGYSATGLVSRLLVGALAQMKNIHSLVLFCLSSIITGCCVLVLRVASGFTVIIILLCLIGGGNGGMVGLISAVPIDLVGVQNVAIGIGISTMFFGIMTPIAGVLIGWIFDSTSSYSLAFYICGSLMVGSGMLTLIAFIVHTCARTHNKKPTTAIDVPTDHSHYANVSTDTSQTADVPTDNSQYANVSTDNFQTADVPTGNSNNVSLPDDHSHYTDVSTDNSQTADVPTYNSHYANVSTNNSQTADVPTNNSQTADVLTYNSHYANVSTDNSQTVNVPIDHSNNVSLPDDHSHYANVSTDNSQTGDVATDHSNNVNVPTDHSHYTNVSTDHSVQQH